MRPIVLWDIDGTLIRSGGGRVSVNSFLRTLQAAASLGEPPLYPKDAGGKTDLQLALEVLAAASIVDAASTAGILQAFSEAYGSELHSLRSELTTDLRVLPGVPEALLGLQERGVCQSVLTGNLESVARLKLACAGLDSYVDFDLGAYGSDHHDRTCLVPISRQRLNQRFGPQDSQADIVVVGDTPRDIACARAGGARVIAVATGNYSRVELAAHHPDLVFDDLQDTDAVIAAVVQASE